MADRLSKMNEISKNTLGDSLGMILTKIEDGYVEGTMPVDQRTHQPYGRLHGGATAALAETLGSVGSHFLVEKEGKGAVGVEINANHLRGVTSGLVTGKASIVHKGGKMHVWNIDVCDEQDRLIAVARLTVMIISMNNG
ncbi:MAG: hotdog fold thioesterase [Flavobacteriales bacterium]